MNQQFDSAFPSQPLDGNGKTLLLRPGLTKREYMATAIMAAVLANPSSYDSGGFWRKEHQTCAEMAVELTDDLLAELAK